MTKADLVSRLLEASMGEVKAPEYLKLNPRGTVPTLRVKDAIAATVAG